MNLTINDILSIKRTSQSGVTALVPRLKIRDVSTDSRSIQKGDLFVALRGEKFDGHEFISAIAAQGAIAAIVDSKWFAANARKKRKCPLPVIVVKNTLDSYGELANVYRKKFSIPILLIAGSNGKTTTKEVISHVLGASFNVLKTEANYNNQVGLPRMLFRLRPKHDIAVLEIGTNHPGEIEWLTKVAEPTHGIITNIGREHLEFFKDLDGVAAEELKLFDHLAKTNGFVFINNDDPYLKAQTKRYLGRNVTFGTKKSADVSGRNIGFTKDARVTIEVTLNDERLRIKTYLIADYSATLLAAVTAVAANFGMKTSTIRSAIGSYHPHSKRMEIVKLRGGVLAINDSYNANPESFASAMTTLKRIPGSGKRYVVAGDMFELGSNSWHEHTLLGELMSSFLFDGHYLTGKAMKATFAALVNTSKRVSATYETDKSDITDALKLILKPGDIILVKGSRGMKMEEVLEQLRRAK